MHDALHGTARIADVVDKLVVIHLRQAIALDDPHSTLDSSTIRQHEGRVAIELHPNFCVTNISSDGLNRSTMKRPTADM